MLFKAELQAGESFPAKAGFWRAILLLAGICLLLFINHEVALAQEKNLLVTSAKWRLAVGMGIAIEGVLVGLLVLSFTRVYGVMTGWAERLFGLARALKWLNLLPVLGLVVLFSVLIYGPIGYLFENTGARLGLLGLFSLLAGIFLAALGRATGREIPWAVAFVACAIGLMVVYRAAGYLGDVNPSPLTQGWSEASRYYYASLFFSKSLYGVDLPKPFLHPSRYLLMSIPYLLPGLPIVAHRAWQVILWVGMTALCAGLLARRLKLENRWLGLLVGGWTYLFLSQGPVYYHLLVCVAIILWGFHSKKFWPSLAAVVAASLWAGISRVNWFPVPAMLAIGIYLLEVRVGEARNLLDYARKPFVWGVAGLASAFASQAGYIALSGSEDISSFGSSFVSDLLWYRLLPSPTYPPGILPMTLLISLPVLAVILFNLAGKRWHWLRLLGLGGMLLVLFAGGLVVSTKIGGGSNLHNMDAFLTLLLIMGSWLLFHRFVPETGGSPARVRWVWLLLAALMPIYPLIQEGSPFKQPNLTFDWEDVNEVRGHVAEVRAKGGRVLFIMQRQLLTFDLIDVPLEQPYERLELMEMAMSNNRKYLDQFEADLREHRYAMIIVDHQTMIWKGPETAFPEENNVWVERVSVPLMEYYESSHLLPNHGIQVLEPKGAPSGAPTGAGE